MGYLPIILAIVCFIVLWGIVNNHTITIKRKEADDSASLVFKHYRIRNEQINFINPSLLKEESIEGQEETIENALKLNTQLPELKRQPSDKSEEDVEALQVAQKNLDHVFQHMKLRISQYNDLVSKNPSKLVAALTGKKPIHI